MSHPAAPTTFEALRRFAFERVINEDPITHSLTLLGTLPALNPDDIHTPSPVQAIIRIEKAALDVSTAPLLFASDSNKSGLIQRARLEQSTDIVCI